MVDENSTYGPPSRDGGLRSEPDFSPFELPGSSNSHQATQDDMLTEEFMSPLDFLYSGNDLRALGRENTITTDSHNLLPEQFYKPEELQHGFHIPSDFNAVIPPNTLTSTLDFTDGGNNIPALGGQNSSSMDPHTFLPELFYSSDELQRGVHILPESSAVIQPNTLTSILDSTDGCNNLHVLGGENSISVDPHTFLPELVYNSEEPQRGAHISPESNTVIPANIFTSTLPSTDGGNDLPALGGESITSMAPPTLVPELEFLPGGFQCNGNVPLALSDGLLSEVFMPSLDSPAISNDLQISQAGSSTSMARPTVFPDWCLPPEGISSCGNIPTAFDHVLPPEAFDSGSDILQSDIGFRGLENEDFASIVVPHDQILPYGATASPLDLPYSGNNLQTMDEESHSHRSFQQDQTLPLQAITFTPDSLQGGNELEATGNMNFSYTPAVLGHMLGPETGAPALKVLYSGNDIQSLVRVVQNWPSASILDIRLKSVDSTSMS
ncbi:hypothetical protein MMC18_004266 [Xylographa bjoerkii]|nr:hypothetical protein [Xylographa bjoerkii]